MTWIVKVRDADGNVSSIIQEDFQEAVKMKEEFEIKKLVAWIEDTNGRRVGFQQMRDEHGNG